MFADGRLKIRFSICGQETRDYFFSLNLKFSQSVVYLDQQIGAANAFAG